MPKQEIRVEFKAIGDKKLIKSIHNLANATNKATNAQQAATKEANKYTSTSQRVTKANRKATGSFTNLLDASALVRNKLLLVTFAYGLLIRPMLRVATATVNQAAKFESLETRLGQLYGSVFEGKQAFEQFNETAAKTPFMLEDIVNAGAQFKAFGGDARELLGEITDLAAYMGTTATEAANSLGRAWAGGAGAADILREKGVLNLVKSFKGIEDLSKLTLPEFREALVKTMQDPMIGIAGATEVMADTYAGKVSNMQDATSRLSASIGQTLMPVAEALVHRFTRAANSITEFFMEWNESAMETMVRQLKQAGVEAEKLKEFEMMIAGEELAEDIMSVSDDVDDAFSKAMTGEVFGEWKWNLVGALKNAVDFAGDIATGYAYERFDRMVADMSANLGGISWEELTGTFDLAGAERKGVTPAFDLTNMEEAQELLKGLDMWWKMNAKSMYEAALAKDVDTESMNRYNEAMDNAELIAALILATQKYIGVNKNYLETLRLIEEQGKKKVEPFFSETDIGKIKEFMIDRNGAGVDILKEPILKEFL